MPKRTFESIRKSREKGIAVYLTAFFLLVMIPIVGLAIDGGYAFVIRTRLSAAADSSALARGGGLLSAGGGPRHQPGQHGSGGASANYLPGYHLLQLQLPLRLHEHQHAC